MRRRMEELNCADPQFVVEDTLLQLSSRDHVVVGLEEVVFTHPYFPHTKNRNTVSLTTNNEEVAPEDALLPHTLSVASLAPVGEESDLTKKRWPSKCWSKFLVMFFLCFFFYVVFNRFM